MLIERLFAYGRMAFFYYLHFRMFFKGSEIDGKTIDVLNWLFRQGLSHMYFPKYNKLAIGYDGNNPNDKLFFMKDNHYVLNVNFLTSIVSKILDKFIEESQCNDERKKRFEKIMTECKDDFEKNIKSLSI